MEHLILKENESWNLVPAWFWLIIFNRKVNQISCDTQKLRRCLCNRFVNRASVHTTFSVACCTTIRLASQLLNSCFCVRRSELLFAFNVHPKFSTSNSLNRFFLISIFNFPVLEWQQLTEAALIAEPHHTSVWQTDLFSSSEENSFLKLSVHCKENK